MEHVVYEEKHKCPECDGLEMVAGKVLGIELVDWNGNKIKVSAYYDYCPNCNYHRLYE